MSFNMDGLDDWRTTGTSAKPESSSPELKAQPVGDKKAQRAALAERIMNWKFTIVKFRTGYRLDEVDDLLDALVAGLTDGEPADSIAQRAAPAGLQRIRFRDGYDMEQVNAMLDEVAAELRAM